MGITGVIVFGQVKYGEIKDGTSCMISKGKRCSLYKIEKDGKKIFKACQKDEVKLFLKYVKFKDIKPGEYISFI